MDIESREAGSRKPYERPFLPGVRFSEEAVLQGSTGHPRVPMPAIRRACVFCAGALDASFRAR